MKMSKPAVAVKPAGDGIATEAHYTAAVVMHLGDHRIIDAVELPGQLVGAAPGAERLYQGLGQRREARDVGEQDCAMRAVWRVLTSGHGMATVYGNIGTQIFQPLSPLTRGDHLVLTTLYHGCRRTGNVRMAEVGSHHRSAELRSHLRGCA